VEPVRRIEDATAYAGEKIASLTLSDLSKPTPCSEFDVRAVLDHAIGNLAMCASAARGEAAAAPAGEQFDAARPADAYSQRRSELLAAVSMDGALDRDWLMPFGPMPGQAMAGIVFIDQLVHAWDLAKATNQDTTLPADLVAEGTALLTAMDDAVLRNPGVFGPAISVSDDASAQDRFMALRV
jgi:uncharacterized protein (TIGR03086 family)